MILSENSAIILTYYLQLNLLVVKSDLEDVLREMGIPSTLLDMPLKSGEYGAG